MLSEVLPGELQLKNRLGVGRDTLRQALKLLVQEGWVEPALQGQQRRVQVKHLTPPKESDKDQLPVTFLSPHRIEHRVTLLEMEDTQMRLAEQGRKLRFLSPDIFISNIPNDSSNAWCMHIPPPRGFCTWRASRSCTGSPNGVCQHFSTNGLSRR